MKHVILIKKSKGGFRMTRPGQMGEEESSRKRKEKRASGDYTPGEERFKERSKERREDY